MNSAIIYYSYSGNTHKTAQIIGQLLKQQNQTVKLFRISAPAESNNFFIQVLRALTKKRAQIQAIEVDLSADQLLIFGTPVWAREMAPALRTYLDQVQGLAGKKTIAFVTYGSGLGKDHCLDSLKAALKAKGAAGVSCFSLSQRKVADKDYIQGLIKKAIAVASS